MKIKLYFNKSLEENAGILFDLSKKLKKKKEGAFNAIKELEDKLKNLEKEKVKLLESFLKERKEERLEWYEKFRWFVTSNGFLFVLGKDATSNEILVKKHTEKGDLVFHSNAPGSGFGILKKNYNFIDKTLTFSELDLQECANFLFSFSKEARAGALSGEVFYVKPEQVTKEAPSGEYLTKGSFMIKGKRNFLAAKFDLGIGLFNSKVMVAPISALIKHSPIVIEIKPGYNKFSVVAKKIAKLLSKEVHEVERVLLPGKLDFRVVSNNLNKS